jgi:hypothetical protein
MQLINRISLPFALVALALPAHAEPTDAFLTQIESHQEARATSFWDIFRGKTPRAADLVVTVTDTDGHPLAGASVLAGQSAGVPFPGNVATTAADGTASFTSDSLRGPVTVTASLAGFSTVSLLNSSANTVAIALQRNPDERGYGFLRGHLNGIPQTSGSSLDVGFFVPAARPETLLNFDVQSFVSSYTVKVNVYGDRNIPGNVVLPTQTKFYGIIPISISKPDYVMPLPSTTEAHMYGIAGNVPISQAVSLVQNKDYLGLLNVVQLTNVGWTRDRVQVHGNDNFDINLSHVVQPGQLTAQLSGLSGPNRLDAVAVSLVDPSGDKGDYVAMDIKALRSEDLHNGAGSLRLGAIRSRAALANSYVFTALFDKTQMQNSSSRWVVGSVRPASSSAIPFSKFLSPIRTQGVTQANRDYRFTSPAANGVTPDLVLVNIVSEKNNPETMGKTRTVLWSALVPGATDHVTLPDLGRPVLPPPDSSKGETYHWEVISYRTSTGHANGVNLQASLKDLQDVSTLIQAY